MTLALDDVEVGASLPERVRVISREDVRAYADASGDYNPLHLDDAAARSAGFPGVIGHGMLTMGHLASSLVDWAGHPSAIVRMRVLFRAPVLAGETIVAGGTVRAIDPDRRIATVDVWVKVERGGETAWPIRKSTADVRLA